LRSFALSSRRSDRSISASGGAPGAIVINGQSLAEAWLGDSAMGFGASRQLIGCWVSARTSARGLFAYGRYQRMEIARGCLGGKIPVPQRHVKGRVLAAHEAGEPNPIFLTKRERHQQQWPTVGVVGDNDERQKSLALTDLPLPRSEEIESLEGRREMLRSLKAAPNCLRLNEIGKNFDVRDAARL